LTREALTGEHCRSCGRRLAGGQDGGCIHINPPQCSVIAPARVVGDKSTRNDRFAAFRGEIGSRCLIRLDKVGLKYASGGEVLREVSFHLKPGSFYFLTGPSGAGKTSLLRLLFMTNKPTRGRLQLFGEDITDYSPSKRAQLRRRIGIVFQDFRLLDHLTTWENVALPLQVVGRRMSHYKEDVTDLLQWVGLGDRMHAYPNILSGGEKQRAAIARAVIGKPELLLADEPTGNVDPAMAKRLLRLFVELNRLGTSVIIATHDHTLMDQFKAPRLQLEAGHVELV
jgi:cell division transport system ATP-binding protein